MAKPVQQRVVRVAGCSWAFGGGPAAQLVPPVTDPWDGREPTHTRVEPQPAYPHDLWYVVKLLDQCERAFPVRSPPVVYVLDRQTTDHPNGATVHSHDYRKANKDEHDRWAPLPHIILAGKAISPMPSLTRYLVAHEYGHVVAEELAHQRFTEADPSSRLYLAYTQVRGLPGRAAAEHGSWHSSTAEVLACDFRHLVMGAELEYWPHPGVRRPEEVPGLAGWWAEQRAQALARVAP